LKKTGVAVGTERCWGEPVLWYLGSHHGKKTKEGKKRNSWAIQQAENTKKGSGGKVVLERLANHIIVEEKQGRGFPSPKQTLEGGGGPTPGTTISLGTKGREETKRIRNSRLDELSRTARREKRGKTGAFLRETRETSCKEGKETDHLV